ncbi:glutathione s-transferase [Pyrenophora seminiperda CCB06]|uniref:glutathione transferase n=1 Tax=Pyrenophora seminiperda CCB06 TaxID=1302712 RepID=A0A3M7MF69_9PLEO|nr:glutathione s-transferase [Pyrenophora seminiperda CCB06]
MADMDTTNAAAAAATPATEQEDLSKQQGAKITVHWLNKSRAQRIIWLLEELHLTYTILPYKRDPSTKRAGPDLRAVHPLGKSPVISILPAGEKEELVIAESEMIVEYLCEHFGGKEGEGEGAGKGLIPKRWKEGCEGKVGGETEEWLRWKFLMTYTEGSLFTPLIVSLITTTLRSFPLPFFLKPLTATVASKIDSSFVDPELTTHFTFLESYLKESPGEFFCGERFTGADIMLHFGLEAACQRVPLSEGSYPGLYAYMRRLQGRGAYRRAAGRVEGVSGEVFVPFSDAKL